MSMSLNDIHEALPASPLIEHIKTSESSGKLSNLELPDLEFASTRPTLQHHGILADYSIKYLAENHEMIAPFHPELIREVDGVRILSKGLTSFGYDVSLNYEVKIFTNTNGVILDPKDLDHASMVDAKIYEKDDGAEYIILPPNSYMLGVTNEYFKIPEDVLVICLGKSTMARIGAIVNVTPVEPGFHGNVVIEIANTTSLPMRVYLNEGIAQFLFFRSTDPCDQPYSFGNRKYQGQTGLTLPKV